jgi:hypothetical protein
MLFVTNKYSNWYYDIINRAKARPRVKDQYYERHHIIPKCLGGNNGKNNLVWVTNREHFICHWLLTKMVDSAEKYKIWNAFSCMLYRENSNQDRYKVTSRVFENIKIAGSKIKSAKWSEKGNPMFGKRGSAHPSYGKAWSETHRKNASESHKGVVRTQESRDKQSATTKGRKQTSDHIEKRKCAGSKNGRFGYKMTAEEIAHRTATMQKNKLAKKLAQEG